MHDLNDYNTVEHFTVRSRINREKWNEWFNSELRVLRRDKIIKYKKAIMGNSIDAWRSYNAARDLYKVKLVNSNFLK